MIRVRTGWVLLLILIGSMTAFSQPAGSAVSKVGTTSAAFLEIPVGSRALALGGAFVATANDVTSLYWNPAGAARLSRFGAVFARTNWIADMKFDYAAAVAPLGDFGTLGLSFTSLSMDAMSVRTVDRPEGTGELFDAGSMAIGVHYARNLSDRFSIGFTAKYVSEQIWNMSSSAFAMDAGVLFTTHFLTGIRVGAIISNFGTDMELSGRDTRTFYRIDPQKFGSNDRVPHNIELDSWPLPLNFQLGLSGEVFNTEDHLLTVALDALHPSDNHESVNIGVEYGFQKFLFARGGYHSLFLDDSEGGLSFGAGLSTGMFASGALVSFDYAYSDLGRLKSLHSFSIELSF
ncbi:MAG TPA: PorV/PorQ family protein [Bacteroidota bacterium]